MKLEKFDKIITAWAESPEGPGWSNRLVCVLIRDGLGELRLEFIQEEDFTNEMFLFFDTSSVVSYKMRDLVSRSVLPRDSE